MHNDDNLFFFASLIRTECCPLLGTFLGPSRVVQMRPLLFNWAHEPFW